MYPNSGALRKLLYSILPDQCKTDQPNMLAIISCPSFSTTTIEIGLSFTGEPLPDSSSDVINASFNQVEAAPLSSQFKVFGNGPYPPKGPHMLFLPSGGSRSAGHMAIIGSATKQELYVARIRKMECYSLMGLGSSEVLKP